MSDNFSISSAVSTAIASDEIGGINYPRIKVTVGGPDNAADMTGGSGAVGAGTPRVTLASDDPAVAKLGVIDSHVDGIETLLGGGLPAALGSGGGLMTLVVDSAGAPLDYTLPAPIEGGTAHDSPMSTRKPLAIGGLAKTSNPTAVADSDLTHTLHDKLGKLVAVSALREQKAAVTTPITTTSETTIVSAIASTFCDLYGLVLSNSSASPTTVTIKDGTGGTARAVITVPAGETRGFMLDPGAALTQAVVNTNWTATCATGVSTLSVSAFYVKNV